MGIFTKTPELVDLSREMMGILAVGYIAMAVTQSLSGVMRGAGDTMTPMWISIATTICIRVPIAYGRPKGKVGHHGKAVHTHDDHVGGDKHLPEAVGQRLHHDHRHGKEVAKPLLELLDTPDSIIEWCQSYLLILFIGSAGLAFYNILSGVLRGLGDSMSALLYLLVHTHDDHVGGDKHLPKAVGQRLHHDHRHGIY